MKRALVIDDERQIRRLLKISLENKEFEVFEAATGYEGIQLVTSVRPDIILLDLNLPDMTGLAVLVSLRQWSTIPIIVLSVRNAEEDIVSLLNAGADDYLIKPFNTAELAARISVALRHRRPDPEMKTFTTGRLTIDFEKRAVSVADLPVKLTPTEYGILILLAGHPGRIVTQETILRELWGPLSEVESGSLRVHISSLRKKIEKDHSRPELLLTEPGVGYRLAVDKNK